MKHSFTVSLLLLLIGSTQLLSAQVIDTSFQKLIKAYPMKYEHEMFSGAGWDTLRKEVSKAQFVLIGETHGHVEIPVFAKEIAKIFKPEVFVGETDPYTIKEINRLLENKKANNEYFRNNPWGLAFFSMKPEYDLIQYLHSQKIKLWGLDQIHLFSSGRFFEMLSVEAKNKENKLLAFKMAKQFSVNDLPLLAEGKYDQLTVFTIKQETIDSQIKLFKNESPSVRKMLDDYNISVKIYRDGDHSRRVNLMKRELLDDYLSYLRLEKPLPKTLYKLGAMHTFKNESLNIVFDIGNLVANFAQTQNKTSLHIFALGKAGTANRMNTSKEETAIQPYTIASDGLDCLKPFADLVIDENPVLFDLRPLRRKLQNGQLNVNDLYLKRIILGNEFLLIFGKVTGSGFKK